MYFILRLFGIVLLSVLLFQADAQPDPAPLHKNWKAYWITVPGSEAKGYGVYLFRKSLDLAQVPASLVIDVSADNRYKLFVNDSLISLGPARGDPDHWNYETIDVARWLKPGKNQLAAIVWNDAEWRPEAQTTVQTGFILAGSDDRLNTDDSWKCIRDSSYAPIAIRLPAYYVAGPGELIRMNRHIWGWRKPDYDETGWKPARPFSAGIPREVMGPFGTGNGWRLQASMLPQMERTVQRIPVLRKAGRIVVPEGFPDLAKSLTIPANTVATLLLDQTYLTNAYVHLVFSQGKDAGITLTYAESLFGADADKGNRNEVDGKILSGRSDSLISSGDNGQEFSSLYFRTFRYLQIRVTTRDQALRLDDVYGVFTGYPFVNRTVFDAGDTTLNKMLRIGWRTARLCATETYNDCPYYEQLQYIGDGRIQALVSLYNSADDRLVRNAINLMDHSRQSDGLTESRHPSFTPQFIPTFSLWYIGMLHDYWMYGRDTVFLKEKLAGARMVLDFFHRYQLPDGSLNNVPHWMFTDWVTSKNWNAGTGPVGADGCSAMIDLQLLWAYQLAAEMESRSGMPANATQYRKAADLLAVTIRKKYLDAGKQLFADRTEKDLFSQHTNALAILTGVTDAAESKVISAKILHDSTLAPASIYFKFYTNQALIKSGLADDYLNWLGAWRENIDLGLSTWAEMADIRHSRSDCHAWGSSPNIEFFRTVAGIDSDAPGFTKVKIEPHPGRLSHLKAAMPHPDGTISIEYNRTPAGWVFEVELPGKLTGRFLWRGRSVSLHPGKNSMHF